MRLKYLGRAPTLRMFASVSVVRIRNQNSFDIFEEVVLEDDSQGNAKHCTLRGEFKSTNTISRITDSLPLL